MSAKSIAALAMVLTSLVACGAPPETDEASFDEDSADFTSSALQPRDDMPAPFDPRIPGLNVPLNRPIWDLQPYLDEFMRRPRFERPCVVHWMTINDPGRGPIEIPVTVCD